MKGWYGKREQHSLASKGIKSKVKQYKAFGKYNYYNQLELIVLGHMNPDGWTGDFTEHDKKDFDKGLNEFILMVRKNGTTMLPIDIEFNMHKVQRAREYDISGSIFDLFIYGKDGEVRIIDKEEADELYRRRVDETEDVKRFEHVDNYDIHEDIVQQITKYTDGGTGIRTIDVEPQKYYTRLWWSNANQDWQIDEVFTGDRESITFDFDMLYFPYRREQVIGISYLIPPHLYGSTISFEAREKFGADEQEKITRKWASKNIERALKENKMNDYERIVAEKILAVYKHEHPEETKDFREL